jgi:hypothetical protein
MISTAEEFVTLCEEAYGTAATEGASEEVWLDVIRRFPGYTSSVIHNNTVPLRVLELLSQSPDASIRSQVATKRKLSTELFVRLSKDLDDGVRRNIALNRKVTRNVLEFLARDKSTLVSESAQGRLAEMDSH